MISNAIARLVARALAALARTRGQAFVEYVLLLGFVALALVVAYSLFAGDIATGFATIESRILGS